MGLRGKLRKTFGTKKTPSVSGVSPPPDEPYYTDRTDIEYYKPHEIPKPKYKGRVDPTHQASLKAFSLADAFTSDTRRADIRLSGTFSPGGTKSQSLAPSRVQSRAPSRVQSRAPSRRPSVQDFRESGLRSHVAMTVSSDGGDDAASREKSVAASTALDADADTATASPWDQSTAVPSAPAEATATLVPHDSGISMVDLAQAKPVVAHDVPFTAEELERAMSRASLMTWERERERERERGRPTLAMAS